MFTNFSFQHPRVQFGFGAIKTLEAELALLGAKRPLFVTDAGVVKAGVFEQARGALPKTIEAATFDATPENPTIAGVEGALAVYRTHGADAIIAVGGGSVLDSAKALSVAATHPEPVRNYLGQGHRVGPNVAKLIAVPTTAGTGSEASAGAGIHPDATTRSSGISNPHIIPKVAICDPDLTLTLPRHLTAGTGMDALTHAVEGFLAKSDNQVGDALALDAIRRVFAWVERAVEDGQDREARWHMMMAALTAMMPLKGLGPAHALANTFSDQGLHHGMLVTISMPAVLRLHEKRIPERMKRLGEAMPLRSGETPAEAVANLNARVGLKSSIRALGYKPGDLNELVADAHASFFNAKAPYHPSTDEYKTVIVEALG